MMKKTFFAVVMALLVQAADAQVAVIRDDVQPQVSVSTDVSTFVGKFGIKAGLNLSTLSNGLEGVEPGFTMGAGLHIGLVANLRWGQRTENSLPGTGLWGVQPELAYSMMSIGSDAEKLTLNTIQLPVMIKLYPSTQFYVEAGPEFTYIFSASPDELYFPDGTGGLTAKTGDIKGLVVGIGGGLGFDFENGLTIGARYTYGLNKLAKNLDWKTSNIQLSVGYLF